MCVCCLSVLSSLGYLKLGLTEGERERERHRARKTATRNREASQSVLSTEGLRRSRGAHLMRTHTHTRARTHALA